MELLLKENLELKTRLANNMAIKLNTGDKQMTEYKMLNVLLDCAMQNAGKKPGGRRYDEIMKEFAFLIFSVGGLALYEIFCYKDNFPFPSVNTIRKKIYSNEKFAEGVYRIKQLKDFLVRHDCPFIVHLSEDATSVTGRIQYDSARNQIIGFPLPLDSDGLPIAGSYPATSASVIAKYFQNPTSRYAYCIMAAPLKEGAPSFCLVFFGTDNKFTTADVKSRLAWTKRALQEEGIRVVSFGSDGDTRLLATMTQNVITPHTPPGWTWFCAEKKVENIYVQDHIHIGTKLKSRFLKPSVILPMGDHIVSRGHLVELINIVSKDQHELTECYINPKDKMNYCALQKISAEKVTTLLRSKIAKSEGTATYLDMMREIVLSYTKPDLTPIERIKMLWKWTFFLRFWRKAIHDSDGDYTVTNNFISSNSYACIEINAHCLIQIIIMLRDKEEHALFLPWKLSSQDCEKMFRILRSALAAHCGVTAFSILDLENHFRRLDLLSSTYVKLGKIFSFPRHHKAAVSGEEAPHIPTALPEDFEIQAAVSEALQNAVALARKFKMLPKRWKSCYIPKCQVKVKGHMEELFENEEDDSEIIDLDEDCCFESGTVMEDGSNEVVEDLYMISSGTLGVKKYNDVLLTESSPFVLVCDGFKEPAIIRKSTLCWLLSSGDTKLSSDRLARVMSAPVDHSLRLSTANQVARLPKVEETVHIGDWCAFSENNSIAIGRILAFSYLSGKSLKDQEFSKLSAPVRAPEQNARALAASVHGSTSRVMVNVFIRPVWMFMAIIASAITSVPYLDHHMKRAA